MRLDYPMKPNGMYILKKSDFDTIGELVLSEYMPRALDYPKPIDIDYLAQECFYLDVKHEVIVPDGVILGMMAFADTEFHTVDDYAEPRTIFLEEGTMLVDMSLIGEKNRPRERFTIAHETSHWICHRSYHSPTNQQYDFRRNRNLIACRTDCIEQYKRKQKTFTNEYWEEWQADSLAAALLMPRKTFLEACRSVLRTYGVKKDYLPSDYDKYVAGKIIGELARTFDVSYRAAQIRMITLGVIQMRRYY